MTTSQRSFALSALVFIVAVLAFWPGIDGGFLFDDYPNIVHEKSVHAASLDFDELARSVHAASDSQIGRPLAALTFAVDHANWGLQPRGYKLTNVVLHGLNAVLVLFLLLRLLPLAATGTGRHAGAAVVVALLWAVHPLQVSTVLYVVQRMEMLSLMFVLLALLAYLRGRLAQRDGRRGWPWLLACLPLLALSAAAKESAALFPAYTLALELTVLRFAAARPGYTRAWQVGYALLVATGILVFLLMVVPAYVNENAFSIREFTAIERVLTQFRVLPMYLGWILLPSPDTYVFYYDNFVASKGLFQPASTAAGLLLIVALLAIAVAARRKAPLAALGILLFFASHVITSNVLPLELVFEHRNYFALLGVLLVVADLARRLPAGDSPRAGRIIVAVLLCGVFGLTLIRSAGWAPPLLLATDLAARNPASSRASADLGEQFMVRAAGDAASPFYAMAVAEFERGARLPGASPIAEQGLIILAARAGVPAKPEWWDGMKRKLETRAIGPQEFSMLNGLLRLRRDGMAFDDGRFADAYLVMINRMELSPDQYFAFGDHALFYLGDGPLARKLFERAVERAATQPGFVSAMVEALHRAGHPREAREMADHARAIGLVDLDLSGLPPPDSPPRSVIPASGDGRR